MSGAAVTVDPITLEVVCEGLIAIVREMRATVIRASYSPVIWDMDDFSCALFDAQAQMVAQSDDHPGHVLPMPWSVRCAMEDFEGDIRPDLMELVHRLKPDQCTLVPVLAGEVTSQGGWPTDTPIPELRGTIAGLRADGIRVSVFIDPDPAAVGWAGELGADRVELFTEPFARAFAAGPAAADAAMAACAAAAETAHQLGLGVNAGHDLDHRNLVRFRELPHLDEVSIGHALISRALFDGLAATVRAYLDVLADSE